MNHPMTFTAVLAAFLAFGCGLSQAKDKPQISMSQARALALARHQGKIKSAKLEHEHHRLVYSFDIQTADGIHEVQVDAMNREIVEDSKESAANEAKERANEKRTQNQQQNKSQPPPLQ